MTDKLVDHEPDPKQEVNTLYQLLRVQAQRSPSAAAIGAPGRRTLTYSRLLEEVERTAAAFHSFGLTRNDRVAMVLPNGPEMAVAFVAAVSTVTCAPLNPSYSAQEFEFYMSDLNARALIVLAGMDSPARSVAQKRNVPVIELTPSVDGEAGTFKLTGESQTSTSNSDFAEPSDVALVLHTSGTTSRPKIVPLTVANICSSGRHISRTLALKETDRCLNVMPLFHIHGLIGALVSSLTAGASIICTPGFDVENFFGWLDSCEPTWYSAVPTIHQSVLSRAERNRDIIARRPLRLIRSSSAALPERVMRDLEDTFQTQVVEAYGMTEATHQMTSNPLAPLRRKPGSVGMAAGPKVAVMDDAGNLLPPGQVGEVVIAGPNVTNGYENNPGANKSAFTKGWFRTGDQGRFDEEGYLFLTGRLKEIINRGGEKIAPREIDDVLTEHPAVGQAIAFAIPHPTLGEDVAAAVVLKQGASAKESELRAFASTRVAHFKVPQRILIVDAIPKGPTGKLQRIGLADKLADKLAAKLQEDFVAPSTPVEKKLSEIWQRLLKVERVGIRDDFYALGGDSLAITTMMIEIEKRFQMQVPVDSFLKNPTIERLAQLLRPDKPLEVEVDNSAKEKRAPVIRDTPLTGLKNRLFQYLALYIPGYTTTRVWLHRRRGVSIGNNVSIGLSALIETAYPKLVSIGDNVTIGMRAIIIGHLRDSTSEARVSGRHTVRIENNVYIGPGVIVLPNVTIGEGAVVSAGSVVNRSIPPHTLVQGNPAKPIAHCGVSLGGGVSYEQFLRHLTPITDERSTLEEASEIVARIA
jgi:acyl-CoA synthetase (AMP-forming)/AMP-acid ligase II/acetyltransferase-like isoleucine patch superfamily enzyme